MFIFSQCIVLIDLMYIKWYQISFYLILDKKTLKITLKIATTVQKYN